ncbi:integrase, catalytic region, zinc finger, CCHC-type containing protein, partial [Tanacetum coccineum]
MSNQSEDIQATDSDTHPPMLDMTDFEDEIATGTDGPYLGPERDRVVVDLSQAEKDRLRADIRATNILLQGLPRDIYKLINHNTDAKDILDNVKMLLEGSELTKDDHESQLYDEFEHFRFLMAVKLNGGLKESNHDQLYAYLKQHESHANEKKMLMERLNQHSHDPLALVSHLINMLHHHQFLHNLHTLHQSLTNLSFLITHNLIQRRQVESTLIGLELDAFIIGNQQPPKRFLDDKDGPRPNPQYIPWYRQDQIIFSTILGCCSDSIQPLISSATTSRDAWERLNASFATIANDLALAQSLITNEDLLVHILSQLDDDYGTIVTAIKVCETPLYYSELFDELTDFKRALKEQIAVPEPVLTTAN